MNRFHSIEVNAIATDGDAVTFQILINFWLIWLFWFQEFCFGLGGGVKIGFCKGHWN